jgi:hypothetical protein
MTPRQARIVRPIRFGDKVRLPGTLPGFCHVVERAEPSCVRGLVCLHLQLIEGPTWSVDVHVDDIEVMHGTVVE